MQVAREELHLSMFIPSLAGGGAERVFVQLANGLSSRIRKVDLLVTNSEGHYRQFVSDRVNLVDLGKSSTVDTVLALRRFIKNQQPHVVISTMTNANVSLLLATLFLRCRPAIAIRETIVMSENLRRVPGLKAKLLIVLAKLLYPNADAIVSLSEGVGNDLQARLRKLKQPIKVIYNPGPSNQELSIGGKPSEQFLKAKQQGYVLVALGRLHEQKDYATLIRAFAKVRKQVTSSLWILGDGEERTNLEVLTRKLGLERDVFMPGFVKDPYPYLKSADVFVMSSSYEGGPSAMLQAMACGCKIVSTDAPYGPAEFLEHGKQGRLVPVGDADSFAAAVLSSLKQTPDSVSRAESLRRFDPEFIVGEYLDYLYELYVSRWSRIATV